MSDPFAHPRHERKFVAQGCSLPEVLAIIRRHPALFRDTYPPRAVNSLYLDTPALSDYHAHVLGAANRTKTRVRWYGPLSAHIPAPCLERKLKRGEVGGKLGFRLPALTVNGGLPPSELEAAFADADLPEGLRGALRHLRPAVVNRYRRHYFQSADGRVRLTLDTDLQFLGLSHATGKLLPALPAAPGVILELKYAPGDAESAAAITNAFPFRLTRCSKYVQGIERLRAAE